MLWCNGEWIGERDFKIAASDRGLMHGFGLFETMLAVDGRLVFGDRHAARLSAAAARLGWSVDAAPWYAEVPELLERRGLLEGRARVRLAVTAGSGPLADGSAGADRCVWLSAYRVVPMTGPLAVMISPWPRNERSPLAGLKCASYAENLLALQQAKREGYDEALWFNTKAELCEASAANVFLVRGDALMTPALESGCLPGIARAVMCEWAAAHGVKCHEQPLTHEDLATADEVLLTSAVHGPQPVGRVGERTLEPGALSQRLVTFWAGLGAD